MKSDKSPEVCIAVDAMGGDFAPDVNLQGAMASLEIDSNLRLALVGDFTLLESRLRDNKTFNKSRNRSRVQLIHAPEVISMEDHAASALRKKRDSSVHLGLRLLKENKVDAFLSAGHSGAVMAASLHLLGRLPKVERPAIIVKLPTAEGHVLLLDAGANVDCKPNHLVQFAEMGTVYAELIEGISEPKVALLANGSEVHKGNELTRRTHTLLAQNFAFKYRGYIEGFDLFRGVADVVVCDGFVGNVTLKLAEGLADTAFHWFRNQIRKDLLGLAGAVLLRGVLKNFKAKFDYQPYGAAPLLGVDGMVWISHGSSTALAIQNGILNAARAIRTGLIEKVSDKIKGQQLAPNKKDSKSSERKS